MKKYVVLPILLALLLSACGGEKAPPATTAPPPTTTAPAPKPTVPPIEASASPAPTATAPAETTAPIPQWGSKDYKKEFTSNGETLMTYTYALPLIENAEEFDPWNKINAYYQEEGIALVEAAEETAAWAVDDLAAAKSSGFPFEPFLEEHTYTITQTERFVSLCRELYTNNGGPHPTVLRMAEQFDLTTGARLYFPAFFPDPDAATAYIKEEIRTQGNAMEDGPGGKTLANAFDPEHFYLTEEGFVFWYQAGDLPALNSPLEFTIPYEELKELTVAWINQ